MAKNVAVPSNIIEIIIQAAKFMRLSLLCSQYREQPVSGVRTLA